MKIIYESIKKELGKFVGLFLILYLIVFIVLNMTGWLVRPKPIEVSPEIIDSIVDSNENETTEKKQEDQEPECVFSEKPDSIFIPKINIEAPLIFLNEQGADFLKALDRGVVHYFESDLPGEPGETIFLGHSAPIGWPKIRYDWVFSDLNKLESQDEIHISYKSCKYIYQVSTKYFLDKGEKLPDDLTNSENVLVLISCWPPGKNIQRIAIQAVIR